MRHLSNREARTIQAIAEILVPEDGAFPMSYKEVEIVSFVEDFLSGVPLRVRIFVYINLWIMEYFSWMAVMSPWIFSKMSLKKRDAVIRKLRNNRWFAVRGIYMILSIILLMAFYRDQRVMDTIGYYGYREKVNKKNQF